MTTSTLAQSGSDTSKTFTTDNSENIPPLPFNDSFKVIENGQESVTANEISDKKVHSIPDADDSNSNTGAVSGADSQKEGGIDKVGDGDGNGNGDDTELDNEDKAEHNNATEIEIKSRNESNAEQLNVGDDNGDNSSSNGGNDNNNDKDKEKEAPNTNTDTATNNVTDSTNERKIDPAKPLKKGRTAYFIFQSEHRPQVIKELAAEKESNTSGANVSKRIGQLWSNLSEEEKNAYQAKARQEKEVYERQKEALGISADDANKIPNAAKNSTGGNTPNTNSQGTIFPIARIRKICRLDPDVKGISKESTLLITKATEFFLSKLATDTTSMTQLGRRSQSSSQTRQQQKHTVQAQDVADICSLRDVFFFLKEDIRDLISEQKEEKKRKRELSLKKNTMLEGGNGAGGGDSNGIHTSKKIKSAEVALKGVKPLTSYFAATAATKK